MEIKAVLDRFEGEKAVLLVLPEESQKVNWPRQFLPTGTMEGDILLLRVEKDAAETEQARERASKLIEKLTRKQR